jgi:hypothetical protein
MSNGEQIDFLLESHLLDLDELDRMAPAGAPLRRVAHVSRPSCAASVLAVARLLGYTGKMNAIESAGSLPVHSLREVTASAAP